MLGVVVGAAAVGSAVVVGGKVRVVVGAGAAGSVVVGSDVVTVVVVPVDFVGDVGVGVGPPPCPLVFSAMR